MNLHGVTIDLSHPNITNDIRGFFYREIYEGQEVGLLEEHLADDDVVMEIGAGIGFLSTFCAKRIGSENVFAYEANPSMIEKIKQTYFLNRVQPKISNVLLSEGASEIEFFLEKNFWSSSTIERSQGVGSVMVKSKDINDEIKLVNPTFLIIDIEGGEEKLVRLIDFHNVKKIVIEIHPHVIGSHNASKVVARIIDQGFSLNFSDSRGIVLLFEKYER